MSSTTVNFNLKDAGFANFASQTLTFRLLTAGADKTDDTVILPSVVTATSAANGTGSVSLFRNGESDIDSVFEVVFPNRERAKFIIPSGSSSIHLSDLLVDNVPSGAATQQSTVYAAAIQRANHTGTQTLSTISDAGTIASQASNSVSISGGSISGVTLTASTANLTDATDKRLMTDAQEAKLDTVETNADVTDATNVTAAGALMDSELADLTGVKTLTLPDSTTISTFAKTILDDADAAAVKTTLGITDPDPQVNFVPNSISFNAATDNLSISDNAAMNVGTGDFTLSFFARLNTSADTHIFSKLSGTGYSIKFNSGSLILTMQDSGGSADFTLATGLNDNKWHTYVVTVDRDDTAIAYVDNVAQTGVSVSGTAGTLDNSGAFLIGNNNSAASSNLFALGYYVILHKSELSAANASQIYFSPDRGLTAVVPTLMVDLRRADRTFKDISSSALTVTTNNTITFNQERITSLTGTTITASTRFVGAIDGTVGATTPAAVTGTAISGTSIAVTGTAGTVKLPTLTTTQRNALSAANGMLIYNSITSKIEAYAGGAWVALH